MSENRAGVMPHQVPQSILESVDTIQLPPLPQVLTRFLALVEDDGTPLADLASLVSLDPALTSQFLTVANSPAFRTDIPARTVGQCLAAIGPRMLRTLATCMAVQNVHARTIYERNYDFTGFWGHSLRVAELARSLAAGVAYPDTEEAYLAGLLHDIGQLLLLGGVGEGYGFLLGVCSDETELRDVETSYVGTNHAVLGARLAELWGLDSFLADAVLFHQHAAGEIAAADPLSRIVWSAHLLSAHGRELEGGPDSATVSALLGIDATGIAEACRSSFDRVTDCALTLGMDIASTETTLPSSLFISRDILLPKRDEKDAAQADLEGIVRNMAVMQPLQQSLSTLADEGELYRALRESAQILFGLRRLAFLVYRPETGSLSGAPVEGQSPLLARLEIPLAGPSLAAAALATEKPQSSFSDGQTALSLVDLQLARILRSEGLLCIPMRTRDELFGVMVYGLGVVQYARKCRHLAWMTGFAGVAAESLKAFRSMRTRDREREAQLIRQFELRARTVIHEVANPLGVINSYLAIVAQKLDGEKGVQRELDVLTEEIRRVDRIVRRLGDLADEAPPGETIDVNKVVEGMLALYGESLFDARGITVVKRLDPALAPLRGNPDGLKQILLNLWKNSAEAMAEGGGRLCISTRDQVRDGSACIEIEVNDSGPGIPADVMERLFQPLEPDRRPAHSGVGLSIVASLVEQFGGTITCQSLAGIGTGFTIRVPHA